MTIVTFIIVFVLALLHYTSAGALAFGYSIYKLAFWSVLSSCCISLWINRAGAEQWATCAAMAAAMVIGWEAWHTDNPVFWHAALHTAVALIIASYANTRASLIVAGLFLANVALAGFQTIGALPDRPQVFTGFYYPDLIAYSGHAAMIITAGSAGDTGKLFRRFLIAQPRMVCCLGNRNFRRRDDLAKMETGQ